MPPVFGPMSPSWMRLKSCAGASRTARFPSQIASTDSSGPVKPSSITSLRPASPKACPDRYSSTAFLASARDSVTTTPLPAARPSVLITNGGVIRSRNASAASISVNDSCWAVGTPAATKRSFIQAFEPSKRAPSAPGPNTKFPAARSRSARPSTSGTSGPITKRSAWICSGSVSTELGIPGLPGVTTT